VVKQLFLTIFLFVCFSASSQSVARMWNDEILNGIRNDFARPTVHARNLFHSSMLMYDAWAVLDSNADTFFLGKTLGDYSCDFNGFITEVDPSEAQEKAMSYAVYRLMQHRFENSPGSQEILTSIDELMDDLGYNKSNITTNYGSGDPAALGNFLAEQMIAFGLQDGSNEAGGYENLYYEPLNEPLNMDITGNPEMTYPNNWQPLKVDNYVDQSGNTIPGGQPPFLSPEWGQVVPFSLSEENLEVFSRQGFDYKVYHNPGPPSYLQEGLGLDDPYKWGFSLVLSWSAHLDAADGFRVDISPKSIGNTQITSFPKTFEAYKAFYNFENGGDPGEGRSVNPITGEPYEPQMVLRGDYTRVLAEFWADGPESETPPGHWFTILNYVSDQPSLKKKFRGKGKVLLDLEWDVKAYFILGGAMHDVAVTAWGLKGYYDYVRPVSAIRFMGDRGQSSDANADQYHVYGLPLIPGRVEVVDEDDPLAGAFLENLGKMKVYCWRGPDYIVDPNEDISGVGWILVEEWFPYQRPSFVTPPFAGYVSGHSAFSRAAAEVLTMLTGDEYFPGGMGVFDIPADTFLQFEKGPLEPFQLQWATYRDASDQTSLSRIWGGIHPSIDDIPGRIIGERIGKDAFAFAESYFYQGYADIGVLYPNPATETLNILYETDTSLAVAIYDITGREIYREPAIFDLSNQVSVPVSGLFQGMYFVALHKGENIVWTQKWIKQ
jgi:hypothetical protein